MTRAPAQSLARVAALVGALTAAIAVAAGLAGPTPAAARACPEPASEAAPIDRVAGADRFATAACASQAVYPDGAAEAILARGDVAGGLADALAGAVLADARDAPVLLTAPEQLPGATAAEIRRLGAETVTVLGGEAAVTAAVRDALADLGVSVERVGGRDRAATAAAIAAEAGARGTAFVVNGFRPPDSLVAAAPAARAGGGLLMVTADAVPAATEQALARFDEVVVVGGHGVVGAGTEARLRALTGDAVRRVAGPDRAETAASVARAFPAPGRVHLAVQFDEHLVDAVTAGWAAARPGGGPVLYSQRDAPGRPTDRWLRLGGLDADGEVVPSRLVGGTAVLSPALVDVLEHRYREAARGGPAAEVRAVWVHLFDDALKTRGGIHRMLDDAARAGLNTVVVQVSRRQDAYYASDVLPRTPDPRLEAGVDLLAELVPAAHDRGLAVHAWVSVLQGYHSVYDDLTLPGDHVWRRHGPASSDPWVSPRRDGATGTFLDPGVPGVQDHVAATMAELAGRYDVDAVHVDYPRYEGRDWGYHPTSLERFAEQTGLTADPDPDGPRWGEWRRAQTRDLMRLLRADVAAADPSVAVSLAASTMGPGPSSAGGYTRTRTYRDVFQDWPAWLAEGTVDAAFPMNYFRERVAEHRGWFDDWTTWQARLEHDGLLAVGQGSYLNSVDDSLAQLQRARTRSDGAVLYSYQQNAASGAPRALLGRLPSTAFASPAPAPDLTPAADDGHLVVTAADGVEVTVVPTDVTAVGPPDERAGATGQAVFLGLAPGEWVVSAPGYAPATATVRAGAVTRVTLAGD